MPNAANLLDNAKRAAKGAAFASIRLIFPPSCRLCNESVTEGDDFCLACSTALTVSETTMKSACRKCGVPGPMTSAPTANVAGHATDETIVVDSAKKADLEPINLTAPTVSVPLEKALSAAKGLDDEPVESRNEDAVNSCPHCRESEFAFHQVVARWSYHGAACDAIVAAKYVHRSPLGDALGRRLGDLVAERLLGDLPDVVTYVPSHVSRQFSRGGNGMQAIAEAITRRLSLASPTLKCRQLLRTTRRMKKQAWLDDRQRQENVCGAFAVRRLQALTGLPSFSNQHILLVDDVLTTGATANEVSRVLCQAGANRVTLAVLARAIRTY